MIEFMLDYEGGNYLNEAFYEILVYRDSLMQKYESRKDYNKNPWIVKRRFAERPGFERSLEPWIELYDAEKIVYGDCPLNFQHYTRTLYKNLKNGLIHYNFHYGDFVASEDWNEIFISTDLKEKLVKQNFKGVKLEPLDIGLESEYEVDRKNTRKVYRLQGEGKILTKPYLFKDGKNECPFCHKGPLMCPACNSYSGDTLENINIGKCGFCQKVVAYDFINPPQIRCKNYNENIRGLLQGKTWDGQDFVQISYALFVSRRVVDFFLEQNSAPFIAAPCRFFTDGMTDKQMEQLKLVTNGRMK